MDEREQHPDQSQYPPVAPPSPKRRGRTILIIVGGIVGFLIVVGAIGAATGKNKPEASTASTSAPPSSASLSAPAGTPSARATPTPRASASTAASSAPALVPSTAATYLAPASARNTAAATLTNSNDHYRQELATGQSDYATTAFGPWWQAIESDLSYTDAFKAADKNFNANDEPDSITPWMDAVRQVQSDLYNWGSSAVDAAGQGAPIPSAATVHADLNKADQEAANVAAGK